MDDEHTGDAVTEVSASVDADAAEPGEAGTATDGAGSGDAVTEVSASVDADAAPARENEPEWAWVSEWRESQEPPAWAPGVALAIFVALVVGVAVMVLSAGLARMPWLAVGANVIVAIGLAPAIWMSRSLPVLRWAAAGAAVGLVVGWIAALVA